MLVNILKKKNFRCLVCAIVILYSCGSAKKNVLMEQNVNSNLCIDGLLFPRQFEANLDSIYTTVCFMDNVDSIPEWSFSKIPTLERLIFQGSSIFIDSNAFYACKKLKYVNFSNVIGCGENAFKMTGLDSVKFEKCEYVDEFSFAKCDELKYVEFSMALKRIGDFAFSEDTSLVKITGLNGEIGNCSFMGCEKLQEVVLENVTCIGEAAFMNCRSLEELIIPESVKEIKRQAFSGCSNLNIVYLKNKGIIIAEDAFDKTIIINN